MPAPTITALPTQPGVAGPFSSDEADAFFGAVPDMITETNAQAIWREIHDRITLINGLAAQDLASVPIWVTATSYARGDVVWSPADYFDYVRVIAGAGSTDPASDPTNWQRITGSGNATLTGAESWTNKTLKDATIQGALTEEVYTIVDGASVDIDPANGSIQVWDLDANRTATVAAGWANGQEIVLCVNGGGWAITWSTIAPTWVNDIEPILTIERYSWIVLSKRGGAFEGKYIGQTAAGYLALDLNMLLGTLDSRITFTRGSSATYINSSGVIASASTNVARFDYDPVTLAGKGLLIEEQRTNLLYPSEQIDHANWSKSALSVSANTATSPTGSANADKLVPDGTSAKHYAQFGWSATVQAYNGTIFAKADGYSVLGIGFINNGANGGDAVDLSTGSPIAAGAMSNSPFSTTAGVTVTAIGNGWYRISVNRTPNGAGNFYLALYVVPDGSNYHSAGDGTKGILVFGGQVEAGAFPTSYISTTGSQVTRSADVASMTGSNFSSWFNQSEGTFVAAYGLGDRSANRSVLQAVIGGGGNDSYHRMLPYAGGLNGKTITAGVVGCDFTPAAPSANATHKTAYAYKTDDFGMATDGGSVSTDTSGAGNPAVDTLYIGIEYGIQFWINGHIRRLRYYRSRLPNATLQSLTT